MTATTAQFKGQHYSFSGALNDHIWDDESCCIATYCVERERVSEDDEGEANDLTYCIRLFI